MLHWTILNEGDVFGGQEDSSSKEWIEIQRESATLVVSPRNDGTGTVIRLISARPSDYLRAEWQPGSHVSLL